LEWAEAAVSFGFGILFYGVAQTVSIVLVVMVAAGSHPVRPASDRDDVAEETQTTQTGRYGHSASERPSPAVAPSDPDQIRLQHLRERIVDLTNRRTDGQSREAMLAELGNLRAEADGMKARVEAKP